MDSEDFRDEVNSNLIKLGSDKKLKLVHAHIELLKLAGATEEDISQIHELLEEESSYVDRIKTLRDSLVRISKDLEELSVTEDSYRKPAINSLNIQFKHTNDVLRTTIIALFGIKTVLILKLNTLSISNGIDKPVDVINAYGIDAWADPKNDSI